MTAKVFWWFNVQYVSSIYENRTPSYSQSSVSNTKSHCALSFRLLTALHCEIKNFFLKNSLYKFQYNSYRHFCHIICYGCGQPFCNAWCRHLWHLLNRNFSTQRKNTEITNIEIVFCIVFLGWFLLYNAWQSDNKLLYFIVMFRKNYNEASAHQKRYERRKRKLLKVCYKNNR